MDRSGGLTTREPGTALDDTGRSDYTGAGHDTVADHAALRALVDAYAHHVDRRQAASAAALFTEDGRLVSHLHRGGGTPIVRSGRHEIAAALVAGLERYVATTHIVGGQVVTVDGDGATGDVVCVAHHLYDSGGARRMLVMAVRYTDAYARHRGGWRFAERQLHLDWREDRALEDRP